MKTIEQKILETYVPGKTSLREVARIVGTNHHKVKRVLLGNGVKVVKGRRGALTKEHRENISRACKGRKAWSKGKKMPKRSLYKNMASHIRFDVSAEWLSKFEDVEKLKFLNACILDRSGRYEETTEWYKEYIEKFYNDPQFNSLYKKWLNSGKDKYMSPTIYHIVPRSKGGTNEIENLQFLSWLENRCKNDMTQDEWNLFKLNLKEYLI